MLRIDPFNLILANNLMQNVINFTVWFALVFWAFLETRSVFVTGMIGGIYLVFTAGFAIWFGSLVDHHRKKRIMLASSAGSFVLYAGSLAAYMLAPEGALARVEGAPLWGFILLVMLAVICGNIRMIALPTLVTALVEEDRRDKANGLVGMVTGMGFLLTSGISGFLVAWDGIRGTLVLAIGFTALVFLHLLTVRIDDPEPASSAPDGRKEVDLKGTIRVVAAVPGLFALIFFATFNHFLCGVFMALMDASGLSLMNVQAWGILWAVASCSFQFRGLSHPRTVRIDDPEPASSAPDGRKEVDLKGTIRVVAAVPGLFALIFFATFNNFLGGVFMALMDAYGLSLMNVQAWGILWAVASCSFIVSGLTIARTGLGKNPLRTLLLVNLMVWAVASVFTIQSSIVLLAVGCVIWLFLGPYAEAAEHTTLQKVVPYERQGRVFGFAQSVEQSAAPLTAFLIGPLTQFLAIPFMTTGAGAQAIGEWYGTGQEGGMALVFSVTGVLGVVLTLGRAHV